MANAQLTGPSAPTDRTAIPYTLHVEAVRRTGHDWTCRVRYLELPGCEAEAPDILRALEKLEILRLQMQHHS